MRSLTRPLAVVAGSALVVALVAVLAPNLVPPGVRSLLRTLGGLSGLGGLAVLTGLVAVLQGLWASDAPGSPPPMPVETVDGDGTTDSLVDPPRSGGADSPVVGATFDQRLAAVGRVGGRTAESEAKVRADLRRLATDVYQRVHRCDWETAARAVEEGEWTDDRAAAAFIGGPDAPGAPLRTWLRAVLSDEGAFYRQTTRTIRAIYALAADAPGDVSVRPDVDGGRGGRPDATGADRPGPEVDER